MRPIALTLAATISCAVTRSHNSTKVTSGCRAISARMKASQLWSVRVGPWPGGKAAQLAVACQRYHHFFDGGFAEIKALCNFSLGFIVGFKSRDHAFP